MIYKVTQHKLINDGSHLKDSSNQWKDPHTAFPVTGLEPRALNMAGKHSIIELYCQPFNLSDGVLLKL